MGQGQFVLGARERRIREKVEDHKMKKYSLTEFLTNVKRSVLQK